jgi:cytidylate kinase
MEDHRELAFIGRHSKIEFDWTKHPPGVFLNGEPVGHLLRGVDATRAASYIAVVPAIREQQVAQQRKIGAERGNLVTEGRDQGSVVFPDAELKFYLDASPHERARRRAAQLRTRGEIIDSQQILNEILARDHRDASRAVGPLAIPPEAIVVDTTTLTQSDVIERIVTEAQSRLSV